jgi:hypothetical protein
MFGFEEHNIHETNLLGSNGTLSKRFMAFDDWIVMFVVVFV